MNIIDLVIIVILIVSGVYGMSKGLWTQLSFFIAIIVAVILSRKFSAPIGKWLSTIFTLSAFDSSIASNIVTFLLLFFLALLASKLVGSIIKHSPLTIINKLLGFAFSIATTLIILSQMFIFIDIVVPIDENDTEISTFTQKRIESKYYTQVKQIIPEVKNLDVWKKLK